MNKFYTVFFYIVLIIILYPVIFTGQQIAGGDYNSFIPINVSFWRMFSFSLWDNKINLGWSIIPLLSYAPYSSLLGIIGSFVDNNAVILERIFLWIPFFASGIISPILLFKKAFPKSKLAFTLSPFLFLFNTYILLIVGGGQIAGIGQAYALAPIIVLFYIRLLEKPTLKNALITGITIAIITMFDLRITYVILAGAGFYVLIRSIFTKIEKPKLETITEFIKKLLYIFIVPGLIASFLHAFWLFPLTIIRQNPLQQLGGAYTSAAAVKFFSFGTFEQSFGFLHPNWPENIFGKVYFMKPEFLIIPIIAFSSLFFIQGKNIKQKTENMYVLYFALLGLLGAFLAKGAKAPFGGIYLWAFQHVPGFIMFRDPTKWYLLIALSYSMLIPITLSKIYTWLSSINKLSTFNFQLSIKNKIFNTQNIFLSLVIVYLLFIIRPAFLSQMIGTFQKHEIPSEYKKLEIFLESGNHFGRVLWIPMPQRFGYYSMQNPEVSSLDLFHASSLSRVLENLKNLKTEILLQNAGIKYVIVPYDSLGEIFLKDRKYDNKLYLLTVKSVSQVSWLKIIPGFGKIAVFEVSNPKDHFWTTGQAKISYVMNSPTDYKVKVIDAKRGEKLVFSENYDPNWAEKNIANNQTQKSLIYEMLFNSFVLPKSGDYSLEIYYKPQSLVWFGLVVTLVTLVGSIITLIFQSN